MLNLTDSDLSPGEVFRVKETDPDVRSIDTFVYRSKSHTKLKLVLRTKSLDFHELSPITSLNRTKSFYQLVKSISLDDISGVFAERAFSPYDTNAYLVINAYPRLSDNNRLNNKSKRAKICIELAYNELKNGDANYEQLVGWQMKFNALLHPEDYESFSSSDHENQYHENNNKHRKKASSSKKSSISSTESEISIISSISTNSIRPKLEPKKKFLIFVNPNSGSGKASQLFLKHIVPVFVEGQTPHEILLTERANYACEFVKRIDLDRYRGILVVSGDGLVYEVLNGLLDRDDWQKAIKMPIGQLPGGSANGLACTTSFLSNEFYTTLSVEDFSTLMAFQYIKSRPTPIDLVRIQLQSGKVIHSFLNLEWAMPADVDYESERFRFLGSQRFLLGTLIRLINLRRYKGRLSFLPVDGKFEPKNKSVNIIQDGRGVRSDLVKTDLSQSRTTFNYCPPLDQPVPNDWVVIEDMFSLVLVINMPCMGQDILVAPEKKLNDNFMYITFINGAATRFDLLKIFIEGGTGNFLLHSCMEWAKVKAFRLEPFTSPYSPAKTSNFSPDDGALMVDGEKVDYGNIQGEIVPTFANILVGNDFKSA